MNKTEFENILQQLNWSDIEAAEMLGVSRKSVYNYRKNRKTIPLIVEKLLCLYIEKHKNIEENIKQYRYNK